MKDQNLSINKVTDLSNRFGKNFVEFETSCNPEFNRSISAIIMQEEGLKRSQIKEYLGSDFKKSMHENPEWWHECSRKKKKLMLEEYNFLTLTYAPVEHLKRLVDHCIETYLTLYKEEYRGNRPKYFHSWAVLCRTEMQAEVPHIHHFNPMSLSGVYYVDGSFGPGNGELEVYPNPKEQPESKLKYVPSAGRLLLFPAPVSHGIGYYDGRSPRISIGFDAWFTK